MTIDEKLLEGLSDDMKAKVAACETKEELEALIKAGAVKLTEEQMQAVSGGDGIWGECPLKNSSICPLLSY